MVAAGFARRIGRVGGVRACFGKTTGRFETAINFIGRDMVKALSVEITAPESAAGFEEIKCAYDVGLNEIGGAGDRTIDMRFGGEMHDVSDLMTFDDLEQRGFVAKV